MKFKLNKKCPRCETKSPIAIVVCPNCQLNFQKFDMATNKEAKEAYRAGDRDQVLFRKGCPVDVSKIKLLLMCIFLGFLGGHYYYVGRYKKGIFFTAFFFVGVINAVVNSVLKVSPTGDLWQVFTLLVLIWGIVLFMWIVDIANILFNRFKVPVSLRR